MRMPCHSPGYETVKKRTLLKDALIRRGLFVFGFAVG